MHFIYDLQRDILKDYRFGINVILRKKYCAIPNEFFQEKQYV